MKVHDITQGNSDWHKFRREHYPASESSIVMGINPYMTRDELLHARATGEEKEHGSYTQKIFENGHKVEAMAREIIENEIYEDLSPVTCSDGKFSCSCDGITFNGSLVFEHKQWNKKLAGQVSNEELPDYHMSQCQHILMVTGAKRLLFVVSNGTVGKWETMEVFPDHGYWKKIRAAWDQFQADLDAYVPEVKQETKQADVIKNLPALAVQIEGKIIASNLDLFKDQADNFLASVNTDLTTDEDFANAESQAKFCRDTAKQLKLSKKALMSQNASIDDLMNTIDLMTGQFDSKGLELEKAVKSQKETIKRNLIASATNELNEFIGKINDEIQPVSLAANADFFSATKGLKSTTKNALNNLKNAINTELATAKVKATEESQKVKENLLWFKSEDRNKTLFPDLGQLLLKDYDYFVAVVELRISKFEAEQREIEAKAQELKDVKKPKVINADELKSIGDTEPHVVTSGVIKKSFLTESDKEQMSVDALIHCGFTEKDSEIIVSLIINGSIPNIRFIGD